jgi:hypothetical protein
MFPLQMKKVRQSSSRQLGTVYSSSEEEEQTADACRTVTAAACKTSRQVMYSLNTPKWRKKSQHNTYYEKI